MNAINDGLHFFTIMQFFLNKYSFFKIYEKNHQNYVLFKITRFFSLNKINFYRLVLRKNDSRVPGLFVRTSWRNIHSWRFGSIDPSVTAVFATVSATATLFIPAVVDASRRISNFLCAAVAGVATRRGAWRRRRTTPRGRASRYRISSSCGCRAKLFRVSWKLYRVVRCVRQEPPSGREKKRCAPLTSDCGAVLRVVRRFVRQPGVLSRRHVVVDSRLVRSQVR